MRDHQLQMDSGHRTMTLPRSNIYDLSRRLCASVLWVPCLFQAQSLFGFYQFLYVNEHRKMSTSCKGCFMSIIDHRPTFCLRPHCRGFPQMHVGLSRDGIGRYAIVFQALESCNLCGRNKLHISALISCLSPSAIK